MKTLALTLALLLLAVPAFALQANLSWTNPPAGATNILVQKAATSGGPFTTLHTLAPTASTDSDPAITLGTQVCYQLIWVYPLGNSPALGPACGTPNVGPAGTGLTIIFQP